MALETGKHFWQTLGLGALAGMRSMSAPAVTSHILSHHHANKLEGTPLNFIQSDKVATALKVLAMGELVGDKMPKAPDRIQPIALGARILSGALAGASIYKAAGSNAVAGAVIGGAAAVASTFAFFYLRKTTVHHTKLIDPIAGAIEDALVLGGSTVLATTA
ncbi:DUF4126 family protein [Mucilaginibacter sp. RS28]|uniref:DUF4126 family protein n=1 Tax=Mucilaginibacter straminoryzae TaxID=2932774 RepID=A0A9X1X5Y2_9SPHI|nr:DUF4126 family protein [Mucilaginibacter straminoryzae]MCJ8211538.1 DUF4126 family protein [Mucilaginibacter straminoryzae]